MGCTSSHKMPDDDAYDKFIGRTSTNYSNTMSDGVSNAEDKDMREKLMVQRKAKDAESESEKSKQQEKEELSANKLRLQNAQATQTPFQPKADAMDQLKAERLAMEEKRRKEQQECHQQMIVAYQTTLYQSFPSHPYYYIKAASGLAIGRSHFLHADNAGQLRASGERPIRHAGYFKFEQCPDGSYAIYSMSKEKYMQPDTSCNSVPVCFNAEDCSTANAKFMLSIHQQFEQPGILVDIQSKTNGCFLSEGNHGNFIVAKSRALPDIKFLIVPL